MFKENRDTTERQQKKSHPTSLPHSLPRHYIAFGVSSLPVLSAHHGYKEMPFRPFILEWDRHTSIFTEG